MSTTKNKEQLVQQLATLKQREKKIQRMIKIKEKKAKELERAARTHRLCVVAGVLEKVIGEEIPINRSTLNNLQVVFYNNRELIKSCFEKD